MGVERPSISVALVTRNRPDSLERTLQSLRAQDTQPLEVVVSDDSDDGLTADVERVSQAHGCRYVRGPRFGLYANRNHVAYHCRGTHIRTMDDDHEFPAGHWAAIEHAVVIDSTAVWIIGEYYPGSQVRTVPPPCPGQLHPRGYSTAPSDTQMSWAFADGAAVIPASTFRLSGGYEASFVFGASYLEFGARLQALGVRIRQIPSTYVLHHYDPANRSVADAFVDVASRSFAMWCFSFMYKRTLHNQALTMLEYAKQIFLGRGSAVIHGIGTARRRCVILKNCIDDFRSISK